MGKLLFFTTFCLCALSAEVSVYTNFGRFPTYDIFGFSTLPEDNPGGCNVTSHISGEGWRAEVYMDCKNEFFGATLQIMGLLYPDKCPTGTETRQNCWERFQLDIAESQAARHYRVSPSGTNMDGTAMDCDPPVDIEICTHNSTELSCKSMVPATTRLGVQIC